MEEAERVAFFCKLMFCLWQKATTTCLQKLWILSDLISDNVQDDQGLNNRGFITGTHLLIFTKIANQRIVSIMNHHLKIDNKISVLILNKFQGVELFCLFLSITICSL